MSASPPASPTDTASATPPASGAEHNEADVAFATDMIPHHAQAVEMSDMVLGKKGLDPKIRALAERIKAAQAPEIEQMSQWLESWGAPVPDTGGGHEHHGMPGMMGLGQMKQLQDASAREARTLFLKGMIQHHAGAVAMATKETREGANSDAKKLATQIIRDQKAEIAEMAKLLRR